MEHDGQEARYFACTRAREAHCDNKPLEHYSTRSIGVWAATLALLCVAVGGQVAFAQEVSACYGTDCYKSLSGAVAAMRADSPYGPLARNPKGSVVESNATRTVVRITYEIDSRVPESYLGPGYLMGGHGVQSTGCSPAESAATLCADEDTLISLYSTKYKSGLTTCSLRNERVEGTYLEPFRSSSAAFRSRRGTLDFRTQGDKWWKLEGKCPAWEAGEYSLYQLLLIKSQDYVCPAGFYARTGYSPGNAPAGTGPSLIIEGNKLCKPEVDTKYITVTTTQVASCSTAHPCHPTTGDKSRSEVDFTFAGRPFVRSYHSLGQLNGNSGSAPGWIHTYEPRIEFYQAYNLVDENGYFEGFENLGSGRYRGKNSIDRVMTYISGGLFRLRDGQYVKEFNASGKLIAVIDEQQPRNSTTLAYVDGLLSTVTDATGRQLRFSYDFGRLTSIKLPDGNAVNYGYDNDGNLTTVDYGGGVVRRYHYHEPSSALPTQVHLLTGITSENGVRYGSFAYDATDRVISSALHGADGALVERTTLAYQSDTSVAVTTDGHGTKTFTIQPGLYRRPLSVVDASGTTSSTYRTDGRLASRTLPGGSRTEYAYTDAYQSAVIEAAGTDDERRIVTERDALNRILRNETWGKVEGVSTLLRRSAWTYNDRGQAATMSEQDPVSGEIRTSTSTYCESAGVAAGACPMVGLIVSIDGPRSDINDVTSYQYYGADHQDCAASPTTCAWRKGDLWKVTNAKGQVTETTRYDGAGRVLSTKDGNGVITDFQYDSRGRLTGRTTRASN